ncbi:hypothetical protein Dimus_039664 [Dionaea muscipula]
MTSASSFPFPRLAADNYTRWSVQMQTYLGGQDVWDAVETGVDELLASVNTVKLQREVRVRDQRALSIIQQGVDDMNLGKIVSLKTAKAAWDLLKSAFKGVERVQRVRLQTLRGNWEDLRMKEDESVSDYCSRVKAIVNLLSHNGETLAEVRIVEKILRSLDARFDPVVIAIEEGKDVPTLSMEELLGSLIAHEEKLLRRSKGLLEQALQAKVQIKENSDHRYDWRGSRGGRWNSRGRGRRGNFRGFGRGRGNSGYHGRGNSGSGYHHGNSSSSSGDSTDFSSNKQKVDKHKIQCYNCKRFGHYVYECYSGRSGVNGKAHMSNIEEFVNTPSLLLAACDNGTVSDDQCVWCFDTGASNHMCGKRSLFADLDETVTGMVTFGDFSKIEVKGKGRILIRLRNGKCEYISDVYYVPRMRTNILSVGQLLEKGYVVFMADRLLTLSDQCGTLIAKVPMSTNRMFMLHIQPVSSDSCMRAATMTDDVLWHSRFGHLNIDSLTKMIKEEMVVRLPSLQFKSLKSCEALFIGETSSEQIPEKQ